MKQSNHRNKTLSMAAVAVSLLCVLTATADRVLTVWGGGSKLFSTSVLKADSIGFGQKGDSIELYNAAGHRLYAAERSKVDSLVISGSFDKSSYPTLNVRRGYSGLTPAYNSSTKIYTLVTEAETSYIYTDRLTEDLPADSCVLSFEYDCPGGLYTFQVFFADPVDNTRSLQFANLPATDGWTTFRKTISACRTLCNWGKKGDRLRLDFGRANATLRLRNLRILRATDEEAQADSAINARAEMAARIDSYLNTSFASQITDVTVSPDSVRISGNINGKGSFVVADISPDNDITEMKEFDITVPVEAGDGGRFVVSLPRYRANGSVSTYDRALSKWALVSEVEGRQTLASHAHYADSVAPVRSPEKVEFKNKKGIGAGSGDMYINDFDSLGLGSITNNIDINYVISKNASGTYTQPYCYGGKTYYINIAHINSIDDILQAAYKRSMVVEAIILIPGSSPLRDPESTNGSYSMPDMTTPEAVNIYAAVLNFLANRYSSGEHGRIHHWIMHNEVDQNDVWTNMGVQPEVRYNDRYVKSMRMCYNIVRQYDQNASVLASYTHSWNVAPTLLTNNFAPRLMLEQTVEYSAIEGDFRWGVAYHPYPINLFAPEFWKNDVGQASFSNNSRFVTFYNPEVINAWILDNTHRYKDGTKRMLVFSEQGTNSPSYSNNDLALQAAGAAWIWKKIHKLDGIDAMQWHNWRDHEEESGLRIGLRSWKEGQFESLSPKPAWYVWQAAGTDREDAVFAPYLNTIGISSWNSIIQPVE